MKVARKFRGSSYVPQKENSKLTIYRVTGLWIEKMYDLITLACPCTDPHKVLVVWSARGLGKYYSRYKFLSHEKLNKLVNLICTLFFLSCFTRSSSIIAVTRTRNLSRIWKSQTNRFYHKLLLCDDLFIYAPILLTYYLIFVFVSFISYKFGCFCIFLVSPQKVVILVCSTHRGTIQFTSILNC